MIIRCYMCVKEYGMGGQVKSQKLKKPKSGWVHILEATTKKSEDLLNQTNAQA